MPPPSEVSDPKLGSAGLVYVDASMPGMTRVKRGAKFAYRDVKGKWVRDDDELARIRKLAIPPAYEGVWICPLSNGHLQATGRDARGRTQYRYHADWRLLKDEAKFERMAAFGKVLPKIRRRVAADLRIPISRGTPESSVLAAIVRLLDTTFLRVGNESYANENGSFGLTTLRNRHAKVKGPSLKLKFRGKSGVIHEASVADPAVARIVRRCQQLPGQELFQWEDESGQTRRISSSDVNQYIKAVAQEEFTAKDFRTWHGTVQALELTRLACSNPPSEDEKTKYSAKEILAAVAKQLGNTPAVCKKAYIHPAVLSLGMTMTHWEESHQRFWASLERGSSSGGRLHAAESRLIAFLRQHEHANKRQTRALKTKKPTGR